MKLDEKQLSGSMQQEQRDNNGSDQSRGIEALGRGAWGSNLQLRLSAIELR